MCSAVGQGALGIEIRADDRALAERAVSGSTTLPRTPRFVPNARRSADLGGGCQVPIAAHAMVEDGELRLQALVASLDGTRLIRAQASRSGFRCRRDSGNAGAPKIMHSSRRA